MRKFAIFKVKLSSRSERKYLVQRNNLNQKALSLWFANSILFKNYIQTKTIFYATEFHVKLCHEKKSFGKFVVEFLKKFAKFWYVCKNYLTHTIFTKPYASARQSRAFLGSSLRNRVNTNRPIGQSLLNDTNTALGGPGNTP